MKRIIIAILRYAEKTILSVYKSIEILMSLGKIKLSGLDFTGIMLFGIIVITACMVIAPFFVIYLLYKLVIYIYIGTEWLLISCRLKKPHKPHDPISLGVLDDDEYEYPDGLSHRPGEPPGGYIPGEIIWDAEEYEAKIREKCDEIDRKYRDKQS